MKIGKCPSCGAPVKFHNAASVLAVCEYCTSTLLRHGEVLENIGKMAALQDDPTLLQLGSEGVYKGIHFGVIGRIQMRYPDGLWNEWYIMFDDQRTGWLGEAMGEFYVTFEKKLPMAPPPFNALKPEEQLELGGRTYEVVNIESATCIAGQGELPFQVGTGYEAPVIDLRMDDNFATIDYSDDPPRVYFGERVEAKTLKLSNLKDEKEDEYGEAKDMGLAAFNCPNCAAPFNLSSDKSKAYGCTSCGSLLDTSSRNVQLVTKAREVMDQPLLVPLGSKGKIDNIEWEVIGFMRRGASGFSWSEYLLFNKQNGYRWLSESSGHWSYVWSPNRTPKVMGESAYLLSDEFEHFERYEGKVTLVLGEFYWKVRYGDSVIIDDYIRPPQMLSREKAPREVSWSVGRYMLPAEVQEIFKLKNKLPAPKGIAPNQPSPYDGLARKLWQRFALLSAIALVLQMVFAFSTTKLHTENVRFNPGATDQNITTAPFKVAGSTGNLVINNDTNLRNGWAGLSYTLVDPKTGQTWSEAHELSYFEGVDDGESWSEGSRNDQVVFYNVPPGEYRLNVAGELAPDARDSLDGQIKVESGHASWLNWLLLQTLLLIIPFFGTWRARSFETKRWADSDHPKGGSDDDDDD